MQQPNKGWVLYDDTCGICRRWVPFWSGMLRRHGFEIAPLQSPWAMGLGGMTSEAWFADLQLLEADGTVRSGAEAYRVVLRAIPAAKPIYWLAVLPGFRHLFDLTYKTFARHRHLVSRSCGLGRPPR